MCRWVVTYHILSVGSKTRLTITHSLYFAGNLEVLYVPHLVLQILHLHRHPLVLPLQLYNALPEVLALHHAGDLTLPKVL